MKKILIIFILTLFLVAPTNADVIINEIMCNPTGADGDHEWLEIYNNGDEEVDLNGWRFNEANSDHRLTLEQGEGMLIAPDEYMIIVQNTEIFLEDNEGYEGKILDSSFSLNNAGEYLALKDSEGNIMDEVEYSSEWGNGEQGFSLELSNPFLNNNEGENWDSSQEEGGTPGEQNSIFINEELLEHEIILDEGWNIISSYLIPVDDNIEVIFSDLVDEGTLIKVKDSFGNFYTPEFNFNNMDPWNHNEGYRVKVSRDTTLEIFGTEFINHEIELRPGWNIIAYPPTQSYDMNLFIEEVLNPLGDNFIMMKNRDGNFYIPEFNFNNIPTVNPGQGYQIKVDEEATLDFSSLIEENNYVPLYSK